MKKIIAIAVAAVVMASSTFALGLGVGGKAIIGRNVAEGETVGTALQNASMENMFDFGGSAYVNLAILGGLGAQLEFNFINSTLNFKKENGATAEKHNTMFFDIAPMVWWNIDLWKLRLGLGAGPNFSITVNQTGDLLAAKQNDFTTGLCAGADVKFYITDHLGIVVSARYVGEFTKKTNEIMVGNIGTGQSYPSYETQRQTLYGGIGAEFKLF